jgi:hypothetical protein
MACRSGNRGGRSFDLTLAHQCLPAWLDPKGGLSGGWCDGAVPGLKTPAPTYFVPGYNRGGARRDSRGARQGTYPLGLQRADFRKAERTKCRSIWYE